MGLLGPAATRFHQGRPGTLRQENRKIRKAANDRGNRAVPRIHRARPPCARRLQHARQDLRRRQVPRGQRDPSHCWEGESWGDALPQGRPARVCGAHQELRHPAGLPLRMMNANWASAPCSSWTCPPGHQHAAVCRTAHPQSATERYCQVMAARLRRSCRAESAHKDLDYTSANGIAFVRDHLCWPAAAGPSRTVWRLRPRRFASSLTGRGVAGRPVFVSGRLAWQARHFCGCGRDVQSALQGRADGRRRLTGATRRSEQRTSVHLAKLRRLTSAAPGLAKAVPLYRSPRIPGTSSVAQYSP